VKARGDLIIYNWDTKIAGTAFTAAGFLRNPLRCLDDRAVRHKYFVC
jgi:hypothetical protein